MNKKILCEGQDLIADFLFHVFPALDEDEQATLHRGMSGILRWAIREVQREEEQERLEWAAKRSRN